MMAVNQFDEHLEEIKLAIKNADSDALLEIFTRAKVARDKFQGQRDSRNTSTE